MPRWPPSPPARGAADDDQDKDEGDTDTTRQKDTNLRRDPRVQLVLDEPRGFRTVLIDGTAAIWEDVERGLPYFKRSTEQHTGRTPDDSTLRERLQREQRVLLVITPEQPPEQWTRWLR